jgi:LemA protein
MLAPIPISPRTPRSGAAAKTLLVVLGLIAVAALFLGVQYNKLVSLQESTSAKWSALDSQYKRRFELIPQLVATVQGSANFEKETLENVVEARASVGRVQLPEGAFDDPAKLQSYIEAQSSLGSALQRLLVVAEQYPDLKASQNFLSLQDQLEGTENRIAVARSDYIESVQGYNTRLRSFPANLIAGLFNFETLPQLEIEPTERTVPMVEFDFGD